MSDSERGEGDTLGLSHFLINARPTPAAVSADDLSWGVASVWVLESDLNSAEEYAREHIEDVGWQPLETTSRLQPSRAQISRLDGPEVLKSIEACTYGIGMTLIAARKEQARSSHASKRLETRDLEFRPGVKSEGEFWRNERERQRRRLVRRCLHPLASKDDCNQIIKAHSVQRAGGLSRIARDGHVYRIDGEAATLRREGRMRARLVGISQASTFTGMCGLHDDLAFQAIEKRPFVGDDEQCFQLAYRGLLREAYIKEAASGTSGLLLEILNTQPVPRQTALGPVIRAFVEGTRSGLEMVSKHKQLYDQMLVEKDWNALRLVLIRFARAPDIMLASAWSPVVDFDGNMLENAARLGSSRAFPDVATICTFPWGDGGGFLLAWHGSSDRACVQLAASLVSVPMDCLSDAIVRWGFEACENIFLRPAWWEGLQDGEREALLDRMADSANPTAPLRADALTDDGLRLAHWEPVSIRMRVPHEGALIEMAGEAPWSRHEGQG